MNLFVPIVMAALAADPIFIAPIEIVARPTAGDAYDFVVDTAGATDRDVLGDKNDEGAVAALCNAMLWVHCTGPNGDCTQTEEDGYYDTAVEILEDAIGTECGATLRVHGLKLSALVEAANLIGYDDSTFNGWLADLLDEDCGESRTLVEEAEERANNHGTPCVTAVMAIAKFTDDQTLFDHMVDVLHGWYGNTSVYNGFQYTHELCWQADEENPVGVNPKDSVIEGIDVDGGLPEELRRLDSDSACPPYTVECEPDANYFLTAGIGPCGSTEIAYKDGHTDAYDWEDQAMLRMALFNETYGCGYVSGVATNDRWQGWIVNWQYGSDTVVTAVEGDIPKGGYGGASWFAPTCRHDFDSDGIVGITDYLLVLDPEYYTVVLWLGVLSDWGDCP